MKNKYYYWLLYFKPGYGYLDSGCCLSSSSQVHKFVVSHISWLPCNNGFIYYAIARTKYLTSYNGSNAVVSYFCYDLIRFLRIPNCIHPLLRVKKDEV